MHNTMNIRSVPPLLLGSWRRSSSLQRAALAATSPSTCVLRPARLRCRAAPRYPSGATRPSARGDPARRPDVIVNQGDMVTVNLHQHAH